MSEYPKGLRYQAPGSEFERRTPPDHPLIPERQVTTRETSLFVRRLYYSFLISASEGRDTTATTIDDVMAGYTGIHIHETHNVRQVF